MTTDSSAVQIADELKLPQNEPVALLIGVEEYRDYDPSGARDLRAGRNDVMAYWKVCRRLGYKPQNIWVLTTPKLHPSWIYEAELDLDLVEDPDRSLENFNERAETWCAKNGVKLDTATKANIESHADGLSIGIIDVREVNGEIKIQGSPGFLVYSGHGARIGGQLALCPSDVKSDLDGAITLADLKTRILGDDQPEGKELSRNLTVVLDCCFAASRGQQKNSSQLLPTLGEAKKIDKNEKAVVPMIELGSRVFCASGPDEQSYQAMLGGYWYSAFTWAFTVALEQWTIYESGSSQSNESNKHSTISHSELLFRTRMLLKALSFRQHPLLVGKVGLSNEPVFSHYDKRGTATSSVKPNAERPDVQLVPDYKYIINFNTDKEKQIPLAVIAVTYNENNDAIEKWYLHSANLAKIGNATSLLVNTQTFPRRTSLNLPAEYQEKIVSAGKDDDWKNSTISHCTIDGTGTDYYFAQSNTTSINYCLRIKVDTVKKTINGAVWYASEKPTSRIQLGAAGTLFNMWKRVTNSSDITEKFYWLKSW